MASGTRRSRQTTTWLLPADEEALGEAVARGLPGAGWWCVPPAPPAAAERHRHASLPDALDCGGLQAVLPLPVDVAPGAATAQVQVLRGIDREPGRLAVGGYDDPRVRADADVVWQALRAVSTLAHATAATGTADTSPPHAPRIGRAARAAYDAGTRVPTYRGAPVVLRGTAAPRDAGHSQV
ncbi:hypothetical protein [Pimelobacter simplex]|uniref:hypothetical protein n=1 Tax=Nocardioides simplex TaxID=2045 RepID=UPI003AAC250A